MSGVWAEPGRGVPGVADSGIVCSVPVGGGASSQAGRRGGRVIGCWKEAANWLSSASISWPRMNLAGQGGSGLGWLASTRDAPRKFVLERRDLPALRLAQAHDDQPGDVAAVQAVDVKGMPSRVDEELTAAHGARRTAR